MDAWVLVREASHLTGMQTEHREFFDLLSHCLLPPRTVSCLAHERRDGITALRARAQLSAITLLATPAKKQVTLQSH